MVKIAMFNNKGGVGKSTSAINVAHAMTRLGKKVLVVDCDTQQNTVLFFYDDPNVNYPQKTRYENLSVVYAERDCDVPNSTEFIYDYAILDLPPALDERTQRIVSKCDYVFVPFELGKFAIQGVAKVTETIATSGVKFGGCFVNKFDRDNPADHQLDVLLRQTLGSKALNTRIPNSRVIKNSVSFRQTAFEYMEWTEAAGAYTALTKEIITVTGGETHG